ncbi:hypothetical protein U8607_10525 [Methylobacterium durans]|uniref:hypothetical protein n=1 Tax=Methylobacterium durans TaxID=2202825 RepID=UPI002AFE0A09|nr:hypothetical protein [Methylobacterium durans]MEA1832518.1 hypothetical protein [Methylobacterium durans]
MREFLVSFHKVVSDDTGHDHRVLQQSVLVRSDSDAAALGEAKAIFCRQRGIGDWSLRADTCDVAEIADLAA